MEWRSSEEMRAAFEAINKLDEDKRKRCNIISMDIKYLYPSMSWKKMIKAVKELIMGSDMDIENIDWVEVVKYLAVMMTRQYIEEESLRTVIPKRRGIRLRKITINHLHQKKNADKWLPARRPGVRQKRRMLSCMVYTQPCPVTLTV